MPLRIPIAHGCAMVTGAVSWAPRIVALPYLPSLPPVFAKVGVKVIVKGLRRDVRQDARNKKKKKRVYIYIYIYIYMSKYTNICMFILYNYISIDSMCIWVRE